MTQVQGIYQCDRCKTIMETPAMGRGTNGLQATEHFCAHCAEVEKTIEWSLHLAKQTMGYQPKVPRR